MIRVLIERRVKEGKKGDLTHLLRELRTVSMHQRGYITGETLANVEDESKIIVLSTWRSLEDWRAWEKSEARRKFYKQIEALLVEKPKVTIYEIMAAEPK